MTWKIQYRLETQLPKLMWLAVMQPEGRTVTIFHGSAVECHDDWMVEGVWEASPADWSPLLPLAGQGRDRRGESCQENTASGRVPTDATSCGRSRACGSVSSEC